MALKEDHIALTQAAFDSLPTYQTSIPSGTTIGKQWKREKFENGKPTGIYWLCEYVPHPDPELTGISYKTILIRKAGLKMAQVVQMDDWHEGLGTGILKPKMAVV